jgi:glycolate oxidase subunit GlcD
MSELKALLPDGVVLDDVPSRYLVDETETRSRLGFADAVVLPVSVADVVTVMRFAYAQGIPLTPRGGGTGYAGGAVPQGGVVVGMERLNKVRHFDPLLWRMEVEAGVTTAHVRRIAQESGLLYPPDPGAGELSHIGGNIATNAGGPHAFKYGTTGTWVTGLECVVPPGELIKLGGSQRKDVAGYDLKHLLIGSEGTLGVITAAWLRLIPTPQCSVPLLALFAAEASGCEAVESLIGSGLDLAAIEFVDSVALECVPPPLGIRGESAFALLLQADGSESEVAATLADARDVMKEAQITHAAESRSEVERIWRWREGMTAGVTAQLGGKVSEDISVPIDYLGDAIQEARRIGRKHGLRACAWGHAGDGNLHATFMIRRDSPADIAAAEHAASDLFDMAIAFGGAISGEHGIGLEKAGVLERAWGPRAYALHGGVKSLFDPRDLLNPGKKR